MLTNYLRNIFGRYNFLINLKLYFNCDLVFDDILKWHVRQKGEINVGRNINFYSGLSKVE